MIVSNFELLVSRIAPNPPGRPIIPFNRRIVQGYFLTVSNLENRRINFAMRLTSPTPIPAAPNRTINATNVICAFDAAENNQLRGIRISPPTATISECNIDTPAGFVAPFILEPRQTMIITILPSLNPAILSAPDLEIRGFVELFQVRERGLGFGFVPEAKVLLTPEYRGTFLDNNFTGTEQGIQLDFDHLAYTVPTASGKGMNTIEPVFVFPFPGIDRFPPLPNLPIPPIPFPIDLDRLRIENPNLSEKDISRMLSTFEEMIKKD